ncbi:MAG: LemA family protein [Bacteroidia bacterium]|nr:LemA family protein [Bacteroidia bacterium]MBP7260935.1 LemA family protein [Bacteroidia bacterium]MBP9180331.1 LemA family protein [Bacteroidia bacterium]MBP9724744.1 LemA family protein [Bacteroidia bacterium]
MKNITLWIVLGLVALLGIGGCNSYNGLVSKEEAVKKSWGQVENVYQRRMDLIPNLVNTVKGAANFEQGTLEKVIQARANATSMKIDPSNLSPEQIQKFQSAQGELSTALGRLMAISEAYPELKATQNFSELQSQLEGTENRIAVERNRFNEVVGDYNTSVRRFPANIFAGIFGFTQKGYFEADKGAEKAPEVKF